MKKKVEHIISVIPLVPLPLERSAEFSYLPETDGTIPKRGSIVSIPFGPRTVRGIVWKEIVSDSENAPRFRCKRIRSTIAPSYLSEPTLLFAEFLAKASHIPLGVALLRFIPKNTEAISSAPPKKISRLPSGVTQKYRLISEHKRLAQKLLASPSPLTSLSFNPTGQDTVPLTCELIRKTISTGQALILIPDRSALPQAEERYSAVFGKKSVVSFHADLKDREKNLIRAHLASGSARIILGTHSALFLPFRALRLIVESEADAVPFETIGAPFSVSVQGAAQKLASLHHAKHIRLSGAPSFESFISARDTQTFTSIPSPLASKTQTLSHLRIINLRLERWKKKLLSVSEEIIFALASTLAKKEQAVLFLHRSGMSAFSACADCKKVLRCPRCSHALAYQKDGDYRCAGCGTRADALLSCPACGSLAMKHIGIGTERVERDILRKFPGIRIVRYDAETKKRTGTFSELEQFRHGNRDVLITTEPGIYGWDLPRISLVAMMDTDTLLGMSRWDADERALRIFLSVASILIRSAVSEKNLFLQTFHPENPVFEYLRENNLVGFFESVEEERRLFLYPPFGRITRLSCRLPQEGKLLIEVERVHALLESERSKSPQKTYLSVSDRTGKSKGLFERSISLREPNTTRTFTETTEDPSLLPFEAIIRNLPASWTIERNIPLIQHYPEVF